MFVSLGKGRKKKIYTTDTDEISHIVNRIAPQVNITSFIIRFVPLSPCTVHLYEKCFIFYSSLFQKEQQVLLLPFPLLNFIF